MKESRVRNTPWLQDLYAMGIVLVKNTPTTEKGMIALSHTVTGSLAPHLPLANSEQVWFSKGTDALYPDPTYAAIVMPSGATMARTLPPFPRK